MRVCKGVRGGTLEGINPTVSAVIYTENSRTDTFHYVGQCFAVFAGLKLAEATSSVI